MRRLPFNPQLAALALMLAPVAGPMALAQRGTFAPSHFVSPAKATARYSPGTASSLPFNPNFRGLRERFRSNPYGSFFLPFGMFPDFPDMNDTFASGYSIPAPPPVFMMQPSPASEGMAAQPQPSSQPLLIELQGDRYVRLTDGEPTSATGDSRDPSASTVLIRPENAAQAGTNPAVARPPSALTPAVLVFRDGRIEEVRDYAIASGVIYARGNYYTDGYWNKTIALYDLNLPETIQSNAARGVRFVLPSAPNEVITRP